MRNDLYLKRYLSDKRRFADLINGFAADGRKLLAATDLTWMGSQSESTRTQQYRDRLYTAGILDLLSEHSPIPEALSSRILAEDDLSVLTNWLKLAAKSSTLEDFTKNM